MNKTLHFVLDGERIGHVWNVPNSMHLPIPSIGALIGIHPSHLTDLARFREGTNPDLVYKVISVDYYYGQLEVIVTIHIEEEN